MRRRMTRALCVCGHPFDSHEHLRRGTDCAWCVPGGCRRFTTSALVGRIRSWRGQARTWTESERPALVVVR